MMQEKCLKCGEMMRKSKFGSHYCYYCQRDKQMKEQFKGGVVKE